MKKSKFRHIVLIFLILFIGINQSFAIKFKRVCVKDLDVILQFYNITDTCNKFISFTIYARENKFDVFKPIAFINNPLVTDYIHINAKNKGINWQYYIKLYRNCSGIDSLSSDTISIDVYPPGKTEIDSITVKNGKTEIGWKQSTSPDTKGYVIYYQDIGGNYIMIDTVFGKTNTFYRDNGTGDPDKRIEKYSIAALDSCDQITVISKEHNTILHTSVQDSCKEEITLNWNKYARWPDNECEYRIFSSKNGDPFILFHTMTTSNTSYSLKGFDNYAQYCFIIRVYNKDSNYSSTSNTTCINTNFIDKPAFVYLRNVTVNNNQLDINWAIDKVCQLKEFRLYKNEKGGAYSLLQTLPYINGTEFSVSDGSVDVNKIKYRYYVEATDVCDNAATRSNEGGNILLLNNRLENECFLNWNRYSEWAGGIASQTLFIQKEAGEFVLDNLLVTEENFKKTLSIEELKESSICFYIKDEEGDTNKYGYKEQSVSNISCIQGSPVVFIPNAFRPKGLNTHFKPLGKNIDSTQTQIKIFNRWGQMIWSSTGITDGWDGRDDKNRELPQGIYYYFIQIVGTDKSKSNYSGNVTLIN